MRRRPSKPVVTQTPLLGALSGRQVKAMLNVENPKHPAIEWVMKEFAGRWSWKRSKGDA
jgi:hypothetical protein